MPGTALLRRRGGSIFQRWLLVHSSLLASSVDKDLHRPRDAVHPDQEAGPPHAHPLGSHGTAGGRAPRQLVTDTAAGVPPVNLRLGLAPIHPAWAGQSGSPNSNEGKYRPEAVLE